MASPIRSQEQAFLADICEHPEDDAPRLIFADWLDEHGDEESAAFIRKGVQSRSWIPDREVPAKVRQRWLEPLAGIEAEWTFHRGFIEEAILSADVFLASVGPVSVADFLFSTLPLRRLYLSKAHGRMHELAAIKQLGRLPELVLSGSGDVDDEDVRILSQQADLSRLRTLGLPGNAITPAGIRHLAASTRLSRLQHLYLEENMVGDEGAQALAGGTHLVELHTLGLGADIHSDYNSRIHARGARALAASPCLKQLRTLDLSYHPIGDAGLVSLAASANISHLQILGLTAAEIGDTGEAGMEALVDSPFLEHLRDLDLSWNPISTLMIRTLASWPGLARLERLDLSHCRLRSEAGRALASSPHLEYIRRLDVRGHSFSDVETFLLLRQRFGDRVLFD
jgi:uncharacterized protein (TIGR02996 family)